MSKILFLDESGDHNLTAIDPQHPIFVLGGVIADKNYAFGEMTSALNKFKKKLFGTNEITLHTADFSRQRNGFENMKDSSFCETFYSTLNALISEMDITIVACAIKKDKHMQRYGMEAIDPYHLSLNILIERFCFEIKSNTVHSQGQIIAEARDPTLDRQLDLAWLDVKVSGTKYVQAVDVNKHITNLSLKNKQDRIAGLEIADAIVTPIARGILQRKSKIDLEILKEKMRKSPTGQIKGYGLVTLPKE